MWKYVMCKCTEREREGPPEKNMLILNKITVHYSNFRLHI